MALTQISTQGIKDGTITTADLADSAINNAKVVSDAAIAGTKISPNFGTQVIQTKASAVDTDMFKIIRQDHSTNALFRIFQDSTYGGGTGGCHINSNNRPLIITAKSANNLTSTSGLVLMSTGNLGIGENNPDEKLHIKNGNILLESTDAGSGAGPTLDLFRNSATPADSDDIGRVLFRGEDSAGGANTYAMITAQIDDATNNTEDGSLRFHLRKAGSNTEVAQLTGTQFNLLNGTGLEVAGNTTMSGDLDLNGRLNAEEGSPPATGPNHFISDDGSSTTIGTAATLRVANNGGNAAFSVFEAESGSGSIRLANNGSFYVTGASKFSDNVRTDISSSVDGFMGEAYSGYFGLKHTDQTLNTEYMILSNDSHTFISASSGSQVRIRYGGNDSTNELQVGNGINALTWRGHKIFHSGNDGSGTGLDADKLDGVEGANFLRSDANDSASGQLTFSNKVIIDHNNDPLLEIKPVNSGPWAISINRDDLSSSKVFAHDPNSQGVGWVFEHCPYILIDSNYRKVAITSTNNIIGYSPNFPAGSAENIKDAVSGTPDNGWYWIQQFGNVARLHYCVFKDKNGSDIAGGPWTMNWVAGVHPNQFSTTGSTALSQYMNLCKGIGIDKAGRGMESSRTTSQVYGAWLAVKRALWDLDPGFFNGASSGSGGVLTMPIMNINGEGGSSAHRLVYSTGTGTHIPPNQDGDHCNQNQLFCGWWGGNDFSSWATDNNSVPSPEDWGPGDAPHTGDIGAKSNSTQQKPSWKDMMLVTCIYK
jgi:hypothetical protein